jgi:hypothetical protein
VYRCKLQGNSIDVMETFGKFVIFKTDILGQVTHRQAILLGTLNGMSKMEGYCYAFNKTLAGLLYCSVDSLQRDLNVLETKGLIKRVIIRNEKGEVVKRRIYVVDSATTPTADLRIPSPQDCEEGSPQDCDIYKDKPNKDTEKDKNINKESVFNELYEMYGRKVKKAEAFKAFMKINPSLYETIKTNIPFFIVENKELRFRPHFSSYLNGKRWEDEVLAEIPKPIISKNVATLNDD